jgi:hypothetical protein
MRGLLPLLVPLLSVNRQGTLRRLDPDPRGLGLAALYPLGPAARTLRAPQLVGGLVGDLL